MPDTHLKVSGQIDVEAKDHVLTILGVGGIVAVSTIDNNGVKFYVYHPQVGWKLKVDTSEGGERSKEFGF